MSKIQNYLLKHPIDRNLPNPYDEAAKTLKVDKEQIRSAWRELRRKGLAEDYVSGFIGHVGSAGERVITGTADTSTIKLETTTEVKNETDLAKECNIDLSDWSITGWECKRYNAWIKNKEGEIESQPKYSVYALSLIHISEPTRLLSISYAVFC